MFILGDIKHPPLRGNIATLIYSDPPFTETSDFAREWLRAIQYLGKQNSYLLICCNRKTLLTYLQGVKNYCPEYVFIQELIWHYEFGAYTKSKFVNSHTPILVFSRGNPEFFWLPNAIPSQRILNGDLRGDQRGRNPGTVFNVPRVPGNSKDRYYTVKGKSCQPIDLCTILVKAYTKKTDLVIDLFSGSGSMSKAAHQLGRRWIGIDNDKYQVMGAQQRVFEDWKRFFMEEC